MLKAATSATTAPCPKCHTEMVLAAVTPHPIAQQLARHTYLCGSCNQTKTYVLPAGASASADAAHRLPLSDAAQADSASDDRRQNHRDVLDASATIYDKQGNFLLPCTVRDLSKSGAKIELFKDMALPQYFLISLLPDGGGRRLCSKVWQLALTAGVRFVEKQ